MKLKSNSPALALCFAGILAWSAPVVRAQTSADSVNKDQAVQQSQEKQNDQKPAAAPGAPGGVGSPPVADAAKIHWSGSITGGVQLSRGQTNANGVSVMGDASYTGPSRGYRFEGFEMYARVNVPVGPGINQSFTAQDHRAFSLTFFQHIKGRAFLVSRETVEHDVLRDVQFRAMDLTGIGYRVAVSPKFQALVVPGVGFAYENKPGIRDGKVFTPGVYQGASWHPQQFWLAEEWFQYRGNAHNSHDYQMDAYVGLTGMFTAKLGLQVSYIYSYEGLVTYYGGGVVPGTPYHVLSQATIGLRFRL